MKRDWWKLVERYDVFPLVALAFVMAAIFYALWRAQI